MADISAVTLSRWREYKNLWFPLISPRSICLNSKMTPSNAAEPWYGQNCSFSRIHCLSIPGRDFSAQWQRKPNQIQSITKKPRRHVRILIYWSWAIGKNEAFPGKHWGGDSRLLPHIFGNCRVGGPWFSLIWRKWANCVSCWAGEGGVGGGQTSA